MQAVGTFIQNYGTALAVTIGVITANVALIVGQYFRDSTRARASWVIASIVLGSLSVLLAFYSTHVNLATHEAETARMAQIREGLSNLIRQGDNLMDELVTNQQPMPSDAEKDWGTATEEFLRKNLGEQYVIQLHDITGITVPKAAGLDWPHFRDWGMVYVRVFRLNEFLRELSGGSPAPSPAPASSG